METTSPNDKKEEILVSQQQTYKYPGAELDQRPTRGFQTPTAISRLCSLVALSPLPNDRRGGFFTVLL